MEVGVVGFGELVELSGTNAVSGLRVWSDGGDDLTSLHPSAKHLSVHPASRSDLA